MNPAQPAAQPRSPWVTVGIIVAVLVVLCIIGSCIVFVVVPAILGPSIGGVFSNIITSLPPTPTP
jgi:hypothetical protein